VVNWWVRLAPAARPASAFLSCACPPVHACVYCTHAVGVQVDFYSGGAGNCVTRWRSRGGGLVAVEADACPFRGGDGVNG